MELNQIKLTNDERGLCWVTPSGAYMPVGSATDWLAGVTDADDIAAVTAIEAGLKAVDNPEFPMASQVYRDGLRAWANAV